MNKINDNDQYNLMPYYILGDRRARVKHVVGDRRISHGQRYACARDTSQALRSCALARVIMMAADGNHENNSFVLMCVLVRY
jgi:hypothetical protein